MIFMGLLLAAGFSCAGVFSGRTWDWYLGGNAPVQFPVLATLSDGETLEVHYDLVGEQLAGRPLSIATCSVGPNPALQLKYGATRLVRLDQVRQPGHVYALPVDGYSVDGDLPVLIQNRGGTVNFVLGVAAQGEDWRALLCQCPPNTLGASACSSHQAVVEPEAPTAEVAGATPAEGGATP